MTENSHVMKSRVLSAERLRFIIISFTFCLDEENVDNQLGCQLNYSFELIGIFICDHVVEFDVLHLLSCVCFPEFAFHLPILYCLIISTNLIIIH